MIQRYSLHVLLTQAMFGGSPSAHMLESSTGEAVKYEDHERIVRELEQEIAALKLRLQRMGDPVSDEEWERTSGGTGYRGNLNASRCTKLIAARSAAALEGKHDG